MLIPPIYAQMKAWYLNITIENKLWLPFAKILKWQLCLAKWNVICMIFHRQWRIMMACHRELKIKWFIPKKTIIGTVIGQEKLMKAYLRQAKSCAIITHYRQWIPNLVYLIHHMQMDVKNERVHQPLPPYKQNDCQ